MTSNRSSSTSRAWLGLLALGVLAALVIGWARSDFTRPERPSDGTSTSEGDVTARAPLAPGSPQASQAADAVEAGPETGEAPPAAASGRRYRPTAAERQRLLRMPDGTWLRTLNGVTGAPPIHWPRSRPYSPVVGVRTIEGEEWYVHEDGSRTTTKYVLRGDLGRLDATTLVQRIEEREPPVPVDGAGVRATVPGDEPAK